MQLNRWVALSILWTTTVIVFLSALHAPFVFDDHMYITDNPLVTGTQPISIRTGRALTLATLRANYRIGGDSTFGYHIVNLTLHLLNGYLVFTLAEVLEIPFWGIIGAAAIFLIHPLQAEAVIYICSGRAVLLSTFGMLGSVIAFCKRRWPIAIAYAFIAVTAHQNGLLVPALWLLCSWRLGWQSRWLYVIPAAGILAIERFNGILTYCLGIAKTQMSAIPMQSYAALALAVRTALPFRFTIDHDWWLTSYALGLAALCILLAMLSWAWEWRASTYGFAGLWALLLIAPHLLAEPPGYLSEHHFYAPFVGFSLLFAMLITERKNHVQATAPEPVHQFLPSEFSRSEIHQT